MSDVPRPAPEEILIDAAIHVQEAARAYEEKERKRREKAERFARLAGLRRPR